MELKVPERMHKPGTKKLTKLFRGWNELKVTGKLPERRCYHSASVTNGCLYIHGGQDLKEGSHDTVWKLDLDAVVRYAQDQDQTSTFQWEQLSCTGQVPLPICHHTSFIDSGKFYSYGGLVGKFSNDSNDDFFVLDVKSQKWLPYKKSSTPMSHAS